MASAVDTHDVTGVGVMYSTTGAGTGMVNAGAMYPTTGAQVPSLLQKTVQTCVERTPVTLECTRTHQIAG